MSLGAEATVRRQGTRNGSFKITTSSTEPSEEKFSTAASATTLGEGAGEASSAGQEKFSQVILGRLRGSKEIADRLLKAAEEFDDEFNPHPDVNYEGAVKIAEARYNEMTSVYHRLDDKAQSIINWTSTLTGVLFFGTVLGVSNHDMSAAVGLAMLIPLGFSVMGIWCAIGARFARVHSAVAPTAMVASFASDENANMSAARLLPTWYAAECGKAAACSVRATWLDRALFCTGLAVTSTIVPLIVALVTR